MPTIRDQAIGSEADIQACAAAGRQDQDGLAIIVVEDPFALEAAVQDMLASGPGLLGVTGATVHRGVSAKQPASRATTSLPGPAAEATGRRAHRVHFER